MRLCGSNLIRHDPSLSAGNHFELKLEVLAGNIVLTLRDDGRPFDPTSKGDLPYVGVGGHGIRVMRGLASELEHTTSDGGNCLRVTVESDA